VNRFPTSAVLSDLLPAFSAAVQNFINSIENAGGHVRISATYRPIARAYLMHYSWRIAREGLSPSEVPDKEGVNIDWTHNEIILPQLRPPKIWSAVTILFSNQSFHRGILRNALLT
jgi:hypothetical protein